MVAQYSHANYIHKYGQLTDSPCVKAYLDSLYSCKLRMDSLEAMNDTVSHDVFGADGDYYRLFVPLTFYHSIIHHTLRLDDVQGDFQNADAVDSVLMNVYLKRPDLVRYSDSGLAKFENDREEIDVPLHHKIDLVDKVAPHAVEPEALPVQVMVKRPNFWSFSGDYYLQFLQNYISSNWYKGGESNYSMVASATLQANYNNKQKVKFENKLEMKLGFQTSRADSLHAFKTTEDLLRYTGKLGLQASKKWYYTLQLLTYTQFARGYKSNDSFVYSDFSSPLNVNLSLGMDYTVETFKKRLTGNVHLAPIAYNLCYVNRLALATRFGLDEGHHTKSEIGSEFTADLTWKFTDMIKWQTRLYGYTTYERTEMEWENTFTFQFNKYISSNLFVYPRFDDGASVRDDHHGYWQLKEYASLGFTYSF